MNERERIKRWEEKEDFVDEIKAVLGHEPQGLRQFLGILSHPDLIEHTVDFFKTVSGQSGKHSCELFEFPWSCAREAEACPLRWMNDEETSPEASPPAT